MVVALQCFMAYQDLMKEEKKKLDFFRSHNVGLRAHAHTIFKKRGVSARG